eukprot:TRINITY_DN14642_c0_g2_i2.p1 TRINITY_DN14642_c0_g2~~TRINITY_DN14642_c0_g2_i2.p1  ORF type:complete len:113 (-),score=28.73 TRINITY_DN14642_c0_g2_i2:202-540(-)
MDKREKGENDSYWAANCRCVIRRNKRLRTGNAEHLNDPFPYAKKLKTDFARRENAVQPLFVQKSPPKGDAALDFSPEKIATPPKHREKQEPLQLNYTFNCRSIRCKRIAYNT